MPDQAWYVQPAIQHTQAAVRQKLKLINELTNTAQTLQEAEVLRELSGELANLYTLYGEKLRDLRRSQHSIPTDGPDRKAIVRSK
jgi:hypothetical protein